MSTKRLFSIDKCPFCGTGKKLTREHLFPKWLLKKSSLFDESLTLLNGTRIPYRGISIQLCSRCNNEKYSRLENRIKKIISSQKITKEDHYHLVVWFIKIYLGLRFMEQRFPKSRKDPSKGKIVKGNYFEDQSQLMYTLLSTYGNKIKFEGDTKPWSFFVYKISKREKDKFWYYDCHHAPIISIMIGGIGVVCCLTDGGGQANILKKDYYICKRKRLSALQFIEKTARHTYKELTRSYVPRFISIHGPNQSIVVINMTRSFQYNEWEQSQFNVFLSRITGINFEKYGISVCDTILFDNKNNFFIGR